MFGGETTAMTKVHVSMPPIAVTMNLSVRERAGNLAGFIVPERNSSTPDEMASTVHPAARVGRFKAVKRLRNSVRSVSAHPQITDVERKEILQSSPLQRLNAKNKAHAASGMRVVSVILLAQW